VPARVKDSPHELKIALAVFKEVVSGASYADVDRKLGLNTGIARARFLQARRVVFSAVGGALGDRWPAAEREGQGAAEVRPLRCSPTYWCTLADQLLAALNVSNEQDNRTDL
jgi:hypothetical protein